MFIDVHSSAGKHSEAGVGLGSAGFSKENAHGGRVSAAG